MRNINHKRKVKNAIIIIYVIASLAVLIGGISWANKEQSRLNDLLSQNERKLAVVVQENKALEAIQLGDRYFLNGNNVKAKERYLTILEKYKLTSSQRTQIKQKLEDLEKVEDSSATMDKELRAFQFKLNHQKKLIDSLHLVVDHLELDNYNTLNAQKSRVAELQQELKEKNRELRKKEGVQTISFKSENGDVIHYLGKVDDEKANGGGIGIWNTGSLYKGDWKDNKRHGKGEFTWSDGHQYVGDFVNDKREGNGTYYWPSGEKYEGEWSNGKRNGKGILYDKDGNIQYDGMWKKDKIVNE
ncbi:hypothetical protein [Brumimicrobium aurantiacum]|uniref:MORN repeat protein n=1 Tax=Brumimicrobium aurantiacum TaxID=1737063 RepID=A0A3E1F1Q7_9FLAO|nr:hypothetical protein [Brumimicrobium aurantiacum]RFC55683.1 hypothetical protein DXU93_01750 [Brumimicrobium aurantiacum]